MGTEVWKDIQGLKRTTQQNTQLLFDHNEIVIEICRNGYWQIDFKGCN